MGSSIRTDYALDTLVIGYSLAMIAFSPLEGLSYVDGSLARRAKFIQLDHRALCNH